MASSMGEDGLNGVEAVVPLRDMVEELHVSEANAVSEPASGEVDPDDMIASMRGVVRGLERVASKGETSLF